MSEQHVIVGAGLAGAKAAESLRERTDAPIVLVGEEPHRPYARPPLSKEVLRGDKSEDVAYVHPAQFYDENRIELVTGAAAVALDPAAHEVELSDGRKIPYTTALLATGAAPRILRIPGGDLPGVHYLRTLDDVRALRTAIGPGVSVAVIGAGWIGCEVAASARAVGADVTMIDPLATPLERVLGPDVGAVFRDLHAGHGVALHLGTGVDAIRGRDRVEGVVTSSGGTIPADVVVVGVGVVPRAGLAESAGLDVGDGIRVSETLATSAPDVFAAGDVASAYHPVFDRHLRVEHWANALNQGPAAAASMLGDPVPYRRLPYFYSDQYDLGLEYVGYAAAWDQLVVRGSMDSGAFLAFYLEQGRVRGALAVNTWDVLEELKPLVESGVVVDVDLLRDESAALPGAA